MHSRLTELQIDRMSGEELLAKGLAVRDGGNVLIVPSKVYEEVRQEHQPTQVYLPINAEVRGTLYVARALPSTPAKIGFTRAKRLEYRLTGLQTGNPYPLTIAAHADCLPFQEREVHKLLDDHRLVGEWFDWVPAVAAFVEALSQGIETAIAAAKIAKATP